MVEANSSLLGGNTLTRREIHFNRIADGLSQERIVAIEAGLDESERLLKEGSKHEKDEVYRYHMISVSDHEREAHSRRASIVGQPATIKYKSHRRKTKAGPSVETVGSQYENTEKLGSVLKVKFNPEEAEPETLKSEEHTSELQSL